MKLMTENDVFTLKNLAKPFADLLTELLRQGAKDLIQKAVEIDLQEYLIYINEEINFFLFPNSVAYFLSIEPFKSFFS